MEQKVNFHSKLSPSSRHRWGNCPGSVKLIERLRIEDKSGSAAVDGTHTHTVLEYALTNKLPSTTVLIGQTMTDHEGPFTIDAERAERVQFALDYVRSRIKERNLPHRLYAEVRVDPYKLVLRHDLDGTADVQIHWQDVLEIIDYKDGTIDVDAEGNMQMEMYALGAIAAYVVEGFKFTHQFKTVRMTIVQPKLRAFGKPGISSFEMSVSDLLAKVQQIRNEVDATQQENAPLVPGDSQCMWCSARSRCTALANKTMQCIGVDFPVVDVTTAVAALNPPDMGTDQLVRIYEGSKLIKLLLESVAEEINNRLTMRQHVPGYKLVKGNNNRVWGTDDIEKSMLEAGVPEDIIYTKKTISPAQFEKLKLKNGNEFMKKHVVIVESSPMIVPESDHRASIHELPVDAFKAIEE